MTPRSPDTAGIEYPCRWSYKMIGRCEDALREAALSGAGRVLGSSVGERDLALEPGRRSAKGNYHTLLLTLTVSSHQERVDLFRILGDDPAVLMII
ncbi:MAG: YbeD family protein [Candidatus Krumholzibacteriia bacterium]